MDYVIYSAYNKKHDRIYVGRTNNFEKRKKRHLYDAKSGNSTCMFHKCLNKWGPESFIWKIWESGIDYADINNKEREWIDRLCAFSKGLGLNLTAGGDGGNTSNSFTDDSLRKMSEASKRLWANNYEHMCSTVKGEQNGMFGRHHSKESIEQNRNNQPYLNKTHTRAFVDKRITAMKASPKYIARQGVNLKKRNDYITQMNVNVNDNPNITIKEMAKLLNISDAYIYKFINNGYIRDWRQ